MADPFAAGLGALFNGPCSAAADFAPGGGAPLPGGIRVIRSRPDKLAPFGGGQTVLATNSFEIRVADVAAPAIGDVIIVGAESFAINAEPQLDEGGMTWVCPAEPA